MAEETGDGRPGFPSGRALAWYAAQRYQTAAHLVGCGAAARRADAGPKRTANLL